MSEYNDLGIWERIRIISVAIAILCITGCASITKGTTDVVQVTVANCGEQIECEATNKKGSYRFTAPGPVKFTKSDDDLVIVCQDGDEKITQRVTPTRGAMAWGNLVFGGIIGGGVDSLTDAHWNIVDSVSIHRNSCKGESVSE